MATTTRIVGEQDSTIAQLSLITQPTVYLYVTGDQTSLAAVELLDAAGAWFEVQESPGGRLEAEWWDLDLRYEGFEEISRLAKILSDLGESTNPGHEKQQPASSISYNELTNTLAERRQAQRQHGEDVVKSLMPRSGLLRLFRPGH